MRMMELTLKHINRAHFFSIENYTNMTNISQRRGRAKLTNGGTHLDHVAEILRHKYRVWKCTDNASCFSFKLTIDVCDSTEDSSLSQSSRYVLKRQRVKINCLVVTKNSRFLVLALFLKYWDCTTIH